MTKYQIESQIQNLESSKKFHSENKMRLLKQHDFKGYTRNEHLQDNETMLISRFNELEATK